MTATSFAVPSIYVAECELAALLKRLLRLGCDAIPPLIGDLDESKPGHSGQANAIRMACSNRLSILCGSPGTGKTTTLEKVVDSFSAQGMRGMILCPTGKAAKRAEEVVNTKSSRLLKPVCATIHRGLQWNCATQGFDLNEHNPLSVDYLVLEEASMMGCTLARDTLLAVNPKKTRVLLCGDPYQLPSIDPGNVLFDAIQSRVIPTTNLEHIFRQGAHSGIAVNAQRVMRGEKLLKVDPRTQEAFQDFYFVPETEELSSVNLILKWMDSIPAAFLKRGLKALDPVMDMHVLSPGKKGVAGVVNLNEKLRQKLNPGNGREIRGLKVRDKVIQRRNNRNLNIVNGDCGRILDIGEKGCTVDFGLGVGHVDIPGPELGYLTLGYAATVHFSQGSEFRVVISPIHRCHTRLLFRNLLYTMMTRGKELTSLIGDPLALIRCIENSTTEKRATGLQTLLQKY